LGQLAILIMRSISFRDFAEENSVALLLLSLPGELFVSVATTDDHLEVVPFCAFYSLKRKAIYQDIFFSNCDNYG